MVTSTDNTETVHRTARRRRRRGIAAIFLAGTIALGVAQSSVAVPPSGPSPDSPGTSSRVWPTKVKPGDRLNFEVSNYPRNETVYIKIDDGLACSDTSHGACVYATQKLDGNGYATGSIIVPNLAPGPHWLRMLATGDVFDKITGEKKGYEGYTRRGGNDFTVIAATDTGGTKGGTGGANSGKGTSGGAGNRKAGTTTNNGTGTAGGGARTSQDNGTQTSQGDSARTSQGNGAQNPNGSVKGGSVSLNLRDDAGKSPSPANVPTPTNSVQVSMSPNDASTSTSQDPKTNLANVEQAATTVSMQAPTSKSQVPVVGISVLGGAVVLSGAGLTWALLRRKRLAKATETEA